MTDKAQEKLAAKGAKKTAAMVEKLTATLAKYKIDDIASGLITEIIQKLEELCEYEQRTAKRLKAERKGGNDDADTKSKNKD